MKYEHNQIQTRDNEVEVGKHYLYFESLPKSLGMIELLEDNSDDEFIKFKMKVVRSFHKAFPEGHIFNCSAKRGLYYYHGMWVIKNPSIENIIPNLSPAEKGMRPMETEHIKNICRIGQGDKCCRYLIMGGSGFECAKLDENMSSVIDENAAVGKMVSVSDNCDGYGISSFS